MFYTCPPHQQMPSFCKGSFEKESKYREKPVRGNVIDAFILKCFGSRNFPFDSLAKRTKKRKTQDTTKIIDNFETVYLT